MPSVCKFSENVNFKTGHPLTAVIHDAHLLDMVTDAFDIFPQPHTLRDIVAKSPKVDDISSGSQSRRTLDQGRFEPTCF